MLKPKDIKEKIKYLKQKYSNIKLKLNDINKETIHNLLYSPQPILGKKEKIDLLKNSEYSSLHDSNQKFQKSFAALVADSNKDKEYKKTFFDLITQYQSSNYKIPLLSLNHNIFKSSVLLMNQNEIELHYKYNTIYTQINKKDKTKAYMNRIEKNVNECKFSRTTGSGKIFKAINRKNQYNNINHGDNDNDANDRKSAYQSLNACSTQRNMNNKPKSERYQLKKERLRLLSEIKLTAMSLQQCEDIQETPKKKPITMPKIVLMHNEDEIRSERTIGTTTTFHHSNFHSHKKSKHKPKINRDFNIKQSDFKKLLTMSNDIKSSSRNLNGNNNILNCDSYSNCPIMNSASNELNTKEDFMNFFLNLNESDADKYNFNEIARLYCSRCLTTEQKKEFGNIYSK